MIEYIQGKHNPVVDALRRKSNLVSTLKDPTVLTIDGVKLEHMKEDYLDSNEFGTIYGLALIGEPGHYSI